MDSSTRHWRFIRNCEFDMAETRAPTTSWRGSRWPPSGIAGVPAPALPPRLRVHQHEEGNLQPKDLIGRKIGVKSFHVQPGTGCAASSSTVRRTSQVDRMVRRPRRGRLHFTRTPIETHPAATRRGRSEKMLVAGELDAVIHSSSSNRSSTRTLTSAGYFRITSQRSSNTIGKTGIFPIMHVTAIKRR